MTKASIPSLVLAVLALTCGTGAAQQVSNLPEASSSIALSPELLRALISQVESVMDERDKRYEQRFAAQEKALDERVEAAVTASEKSDAALNIRFNGVNEFRQTLSEQATTFMTKSEADARIDALEDRMAEFVANQNEVRNRGEGQTEAWQILGGVIALAVVIGGFAVTIINMRKA